MASGRGGFNLSTLRVRSCDGWTQEALAAEWAYVQQVASTMSRPNFGPNWVDFRPGQPGPDEDQAAPAQVEPAAFARLQRAVARASTGWTLVMARIKDDGFLLELDGASGRLVLEVVTARPERASFIERDGVAYSYRAGSLGRDALPRVSLVVESLHAEVGPMLSTVVSAAS